MKPTVWTARRKWMGNLLPIVLWLPFIAGGVGWMVVRGEMVGAGIGLLAAGTVVGWLGVNQFGLFENGKMRRQLDRVLAARNEKAPADRHFVGFASPKFAGVLDAHEDVGFFWLESERAVFASETRRVEFGRHQVSRVRFLPNVHSLLGLGRWVSIEGMDRGTPIRMMLEPRDRQTLMGNRRRSKVLADKIRRWASPGEPG